MMRPLFAGISTLLLVFLVSALRSSEAQTTPGAIRPPGSLNYNLSQEITLDGTVSTVLAKPSAEMVPGAHFLLTTLSGPIDVSLGMFALSGKGALSLAGGQQVEVIGVMKTLRDRPVFLARAVKVGDRTYTIRNEHGIPVTPQARERSGQNGETR